VDPANVPDSDSNPKKKKRRETKEEKKMITEY